MNKRRFDIEGEVPYQPFGDHTTSITLSLSMQTPLLVALVLLMIVLVGRAALVDVDLVGAAVMTFGVQEETTCVFLHGAGSPGSSAGPPTEAYPLYWGDVHVKTPGCSRRIFAHEETLHTGWEEAALQRRMCALLRVPSTQRLVIFAHSMANLVLAAALEGQVCKLPASARWYSVAAPWAGSSAADRLPELCNTSTSWALRALANRQHFCEGPNGGPSRGYSSLATTNPRLARVAHWQERVNGSMCGSSAFGLWSGDSWALQALADFTRFGMPNDGAVTTESCRPRSAPEPSPNHASFHYAASVNHYDLTCRHGDGAWGGDDRKPCSWYAWVSSIR